MRLLITGGSGFIGTSLCGELVRRSLDFRFLDPAQPILPQYRDQWVEGSVLDALCLRRVAEVFRPTHLVHLAAETDIEKATGSLEDVFPVNCRAVAALAAALPVATLQMSVMVSTQYVCGPEGGLPRSDNDFSPHTDYGRSKVIMEQEVRRLWTSPYTILRPTYVWGPYHQKYFRDVCGTLARGLYCHPAGRPVIRAYAYVDTVVDMIVKLLERPDLSGRVFYGTDRPEDSYRFVNRLSLALRDRPARRLPRVVLRGLAHVGEVWPRFPMNGFRYKSMTTDYPVPVDDTFGTLGELRPHLSAGARRVADWFLQATRPHHKASTHSDRQIIP